MNEICDFTPLIENSVRSNLKEETQNEPLTFVITTEVSKSTDNDNTSQWDAYSEGFDTSFELQERIDEDHLIEKSYGALDGEKMEKETADDNSFLCSTNLGLTTPSEELKHMHRQHSIKESSEATDGEEMEIAYADGEQSEVCEGLFNSGSALEAHLEIPGPDPKEGRHHCDQCTRDFSSKRGLLTHLRIHTDKKRFVCTTCNKGFRNKKVLQIHQKTHLLRSVKKEHRCDHCLYSCDSPANLQAHVVRRHTKDFDHRCSTCDKGFYYQSELQRHIKKQHSAQEACSKEEVEE